MIELSYMLLARFKFSIYIAKFKYLIYLFIYFNTLFIKL